jgi:inner membrane protein
MTETQIPPPPLPKSQPSFTRRYGTIIKLLGVGALVLLLLVPLGMITGVLSDRLQRRNEAVADITSSWGKEQNVIGPVLIVPYQYLIKAIKEVPGKGGKLELREVEEIAVAQAYFLPKMLNVVGDVETQKLHRGIYEAAVFRGQVTLSGKFAPPNSIANLEKSLAAWARCFVRLPFTCAAKLERTL